MACTELYTHYLLGDRSLDTFTAFVLTERALAEGCIAQPTRIPRAPSARASSG